MKNYTTKFIALAKELSFEPEHLLASLKGTPPFELWIQFGEAMAFFESNEEKFTPDEAAIIRDLDSFIADLPPEPDDHWKETSVRNALWEETRARVGRAIVELQALNQTAP